MDERALVPDAIPAATSRRHARGRRGASLLALGVAGLLVLTACGGDQPYSTTSPQSDVAGDIQWLYKIIFWAALVVFIGVQAAIVYTALRFKRRGENEDRPEQIHGNKRLELAWTLIPAIVLLVIFIPTAQIIYKHADAAQEADITIDAYGNQWWWEFHYPDQYGKAVTANEIRLPLGKEVVFNLRSNNVIHSFWVPQLSGKMDVIPGHNNRLSFKANKVGEYWGECAEFCGTAHAWMRFRVIVEPEEQFNAWVQAWHQPPAYDATPSTGDVAEAPASFAVCTACHNVTGTNAKNGQQGIEANPLGISHAPDLTLFACRDTIGAGVLANNRANLATWLKETKEVKPGTYMPNYYKGGQINDQQVDEIVDYLSSLTPPGGCPKDPPIGGEIPNNGIGDEGSNAVLPAATPGTTK